LDSIETPNGGQARVADPFHLELIAKEKEVLLYVTDHADKKIRTEGGIGKAVFQDDKAKPKSSLKLEPVNTSKQPFDIKVLSGMLEPKENFYKQ
jgi:hypothetical protein